MDALCNIIISQREAEEFYEHALQVEADKLQAEAEARKEMARQEYLAHGR